MLKKKVKKRTITSWKRYLDHIFREWFLEKNNRCSMCGIIPEVIQISHIYAKGAHPGLRYDPLNVLPMCGGCHKFKWHEDPIISWKWFEKKYPERVIYLQEADKVFVKRNEEYFKKIEKAILERRVKDLLIYRKI